jgi:hypothetical protein
MPGHKGAKVGEGKPRVRTALRSRDVAAAAGAASSAKRPKASSTPIGSLGRNLLSAAVANEMIDPEALAEALALSKGQLAAMMGLPSDALYRQQRTQADKTQNRLRELIEILMRVEPWAGGRLQALAWYRGQSIPALGDQTAESLVKTGDADLLRSYLDGIAAGGYA